MRDYFFVDFMDRRTPVAQLPTHTVERLLTEGFELVPEVDGDATEHDVRERLQIELVARKL